MIISNSIKINFSNNDFNLKTLDISDISNEYTDFLINNRKNIYFDAHNLTVKRQIIYVENVLNSKNDTIVGFYRNKKLIGTAGIQTNSKFLIKNEYSSNLCTTFGILIFEKRSRGQGFGKVLVWLVSKLIFQSNFSEVIAVDVKKGNIKSVKSFLACGFKIIYEDEVLYRMVLKHTELININ